VFKCKKFVQFILKIIKIAATRRQILRLKWIKFTPKDTVAKFKGPTPEGKKKKRQ